MNKMTTTDKEIQIALGTYLPAVWKERCKLCAKGDKLCAKGDKLRDEGWKLRDGRWKLSDEGSKRCAKGDKLIDEGWKLIADGRKLYAKGEKLFIDAVIEVYGNIFIIAWTDYGCKLSNGMEFRNV